MEVTTLKAKAERGSVPAQVVLGVHYLEGTGGLRQDYGEALRLLSAAANAGAPRAQYHLARMHMSALGTARDEAEALRLLVAAAEGGEFPACIAIARHHRAADNADEAARWYEAVVTDEARWGGGSEVDEARAFLAAHHFARK